MDQTISATHESFDSIPKADFQKHQHTIKANMRGSLLPQSPGACLYMCQIDLTPNSQCRPNCLHERAWINTTQRLTSISVSHSWLQFLASVS